MRKSKRSCNGDEYDFSFISQKEFEVGDILVNMGDLILQSAYRKRFPINWGGRRRRSIKGSTTTPPPCLQRIKTTTSQVDTEIETTKPKLKAAAAVSPSTPLCFPPSESEEKSKHHSVNTNHKKKKRRDELLENIDELTQRKEVLTKQVDGVREYYKKLKAFNLMLKAKKVEVIRMKSHIIKENPQVGVYRGYKLGMRMDQHQQLYPSAPFNYQQLAFINQTVYYPSQTSGKFPYYPPGDQPLLSSGAGNSVDPVNQTGLLDLNLPAQETDEMVVETPQPAVWFAS